MNSKRMDRQKGYELAIVKDQELVLGLSDRKDGLEVRGYGAGDLRGDNE